MKAHYHAAFVIGNASAVQHAVFDDEFKWVGRPSFACRHYVEVTQYAYALVAFAVFSVTAVSVIIFGAEAETFRLC